MKKGNWYYEIQILVFVFMWQHDMSIKPSRRDGFRLGRLYIWIDTDWTIEGQISRTRRAIKRSSIVKFFKSLWAFLRLSDAGFAISCSSNSDDFEIFRFYWNGKMIRTFPDIDRVGEKYVTLHNGHAEPLPTGTIEMIIDELRDVGS